MKKVFGTGSWSTKSQAKASTAESDSRAGNSDAASSKHGRGSKDEPPGESKRSEPPFSADTKIETVRDGGDPGANASSDGGDSDASNSLRYTCVRQVKRYNVMGVRFDVDAQYSLLDVVGQGAYGVVCAALDEESGETVAIKKITNAFEHELYAKRTLREIRLLRLLKHDNLIGLKTILPPLKSDGFKDLYIISELMETDLSSIIKSPQPLSDEHVQFFLYQILRGLKFLHSANVIHRDMKPRNLLLNSNCDLKICDFGLARVDFPAHGMSSSSAVMTDYVATRWYRAPEIITGWSHYSKAVDMWAVGCVLAELLGRKPIFPGSNSQHQLELICQCLGKPEPATIAKIQSTEIQDFVSDIPNVPRVPLRELYPHARPDACQLLDELMRFDPDYRCTVQQALGHEYLSQLHYPDDEPCGPQISPDLFEFERASHSGEELKKEILHEIWLYHRERMAVTGGGVISNGAEPFSNLRETFQKVSPSESK